MSLRTFFTLLCLKHLGTPGGSKKTGVIQSDDRLTSWMPDPELASMLSEARCIGTIYSDSVPVNERDKADQHQDVTGGLVP